MTFPVPIKEISRKPTSSEQLWVFLQLSWFHLSTQNIINLFPTFWFVLSELLKTSSELCSCTTIHQRQLCNLMVFLWAKEDISRVVPTYFLNMTSKFLMVCIYVPLWLVFCVCFFYSKIQLSTDWVHSPHKHSLTSRGGLNLKRGRRHPSMAQTKFNLELKTHPFWFLCERGFLTSNIKAAILISI